MEPSFVSLPLLVIRDVMGIPGSEKKCDPSKFEDNIDYL